MRAFFVSLGSLVLIVAFLFAFTGAIQNSTYQSGLTARYEAQQRTRQVQAREWGDTMRSWGMWGGGGLAVVGGLVAIGWAVNRWQEQRTQRHVATEAQTTERLRITAKKEIGLAWIAQFGVPERDSIGIHGGQLGVFTVEDGRQTFVTIDACRADLATVRHAQPVNQPTALARRTPPTINVPATMAPDDWLPGDSAGRFIVRGDW